MPILKYLFIYLFIALITFSNVDAQIFSGGSGSVNDPYQVSNIYQLQSVNQYLDKHFVLAGDIDASDTYNWDSGRGFRTFEGTFSGTFNGNGFAILNLFQDRPDGKFGIFDTLGIGSSVFNLTLQNFEQTGSGGSLAKVNFGTLSYIEVFATISGSGIGGIVKYNHSIIQESMFVGTISGNNIGGIAYENESDAAIAKSIFMGTMTGNHIGGIVYQNESGASIQQVYVNATLGNDNDSNTMSGVALTNDGTIEEAVVEGIIKNNRTRNYTANIAGISVTNRGLINFVRMDAELYGFRNVGGLVVTNEPSGIVKDAHVSKFIYINNDRNDGGGCYTQGGGYYSPLSQCRANDVGGLIVRNKGILETTLISTGIDYYYPFHNNANPGINNRDNNTFGKVIGIVENTASSSYVYYNTDNSVGIRIVGSGSDDNIVGWTDGGLIGETVLITLEGFDFDTIWEVTSGYPKLRLNEYDLLTPPALSGPVNNSDNVDLRPTFAWDDVENAASYRLQISETSNLQNTVSDVSGISSTSYQVNTLLNLDTTYYWRVKSENSSGESLWSSTWSFTTITTQPPITKIALLFPENESGGHGRNVQLEWQEDVFAEGYQLQVSEGDWSTQDQFVNISLLESNEYQLSGLDYNRSYYWRVRNILSDGFGEWSDVWSFQTSDVIYYIDFEVYDQAGNDKIITIGTSVDATDDFDIGLDQLAPPAPPDGSFDARVVSSAFGYFTEFKEVTVDSTSWTIKVRPEQGKSPLILKWDSEKLVSTGYFQLKDQFSGNFVDINLADQDSLVISDTFLSEFTLTYYFTTLVEQTYKQNWDLVSIPLNENHDTYSDLFPTAVDQTLFYYDGIYQQSETLEPGKGYWLKFIVEDSVRFDGFGIDQLSLNLNQYWNLIAGPTEFSIIQDPGGIIIPGTFYQYDGTYVQANGLEPGRGYWIASVTDGQITIQPGNQQSTSERSLIKDTIIQASHQNIEFVTIRDGEEVTLRSIYFLDHLDEGIHPLSVTLPPRPPSGAFDARLENNKWVTTRDKVEIDFQEPDERIYIRTGDFHEALVSFKNRDEHTVTDKVISAELFEIPRGTNNIMVDISASLNDEEVPKVFNLSQNYPNPFNPSTIIEYSLAKESNVRLEVFTLLGQPVSLLVDESQNAGSYQVSFDAQGFSTGLYMYRITAGEFTQTRSMMLIK